MKNTIKFLIILFISTQITAQQDTIFVNIDTIFTKKIVLYKAEGTQQKYIGFSNYNKDGFKIAIPEDATKGVYRLVYNQKTSESVDFLYLNKSLNISVNPKELHPFIENSIENSRFFEGIEKIYKLQKPLDSIQISLFKIDNPDEKQVRKIDEQYKKQYLFAVSGISDLLDKESNPMIYDLLKSYYRVLPETPIQDPMEYMVYIKSHYFDHLDFDNINLIQSPILADKVIDYVFYLTLAQNPNKQNGLYEMATDEVMSQIKNDMLRRSFMQLLIQSFQEEENVEVVDHILKNHYNALPEGFQNKEWKDKLLDELSTAISRPAKDFVITQEKGKKTKLYDLAGFEHYILIFWSTTCSHCMREIPKLHKYIKDNNNVKVIAIALETDKTRNRWKSETYYYPEFYHVIALGKWDSELAKLYNIHATPNYFVLNKDKQIIAKPYDIKELKLTFKSLNQVKVTNE